MNKKIAGIISVVLILICIGYIVFDIATGMSDKKIVIEEETEQAELETQWSVFKELKVENGKLTSVALSKKDKMICAGESFIAGYSTSLNLEWEYPLEETVWALAVFGDTLFATTREKICLFNLSGELLDEWGPYDDEAIITSITANREYVAFADAGNLLVYVLNKNGALKSIVGYPGNQFIIPSPYFDVHLTMDDTLVIANTGKRNIEFRNIEGELLRAFGEEGDDFGEFCGCCNPAHFAYTPDGNIVTAEKGLNRIKLIKPDGKLIEPIAQPANFAASYPLDIAVSSEGLIYAANPKDSKIYIFKRKDR